MGSPTLFCPFRLATISLRDAEKLVPGLFLNAYLPRVHLVEWNPVERMTMEFYRFRDFAVPLLRLLTRHPSIHEMRVTQLVDSISRAPQFPDAAGTRLCLSKLATLQCFPANWSVRRK